MAKPLRVLIIEDSADDAELLLLELRRGGYEPNSRRVQTAEGMSAALSEETWDLIACDFSLPRFAAPAALKLMQDSGLDLPFLVVSGVIGEDVAVSLMKAGAHDCIMKYNLKRLVPAVERELREAEVRRERKRGENALLLFKNLVDRSSDAIEVIDPETGRFLDVNEKGCKDLGYSREEILSLSVPDVDPTIDPASFAGTVKQLRKSGLLIWEGFHRRKDGSTFPVEVNIKYVSLERDYIVTAVRDITERRKAERELQESQRVLSTLMDNLPGMAYRCRNDQDWTMEFVNEACLELTGYTTADLMGNRKVSFGRDVIHPDDQETVWNDVQAALEEKRPYRLVYRIRTAAGQEKSVWEQGRGIFSENGDLLALEGFIIDITDRKRAEEKLQQSEGKYRTLAEAAHDDIYIVDQDMRFRFINQFAARRFGRPQEELFGKPLSDFFPEPVYSKQKQRLDHVFRTGKSVLDEEAIEFQGQTVWMSVRLVPLKNEAGQVDAVLGIGRDVTDRVQAEEMVQHVAFFDMLTKLPNRNQLYDRMLNAIRTDANEGKAMALLLLDLDRFKEINDTLGHHRGDLLLQQVGERLKSVLFEPDIVARLGGDEFAVWLPRLATVDDAGLVADKVQMALQMPFMIEGLPVAVEASIGIAIYPDHGENPDSLLQRADVAMYAAKETGGCVIYDAKHDHHSPRRLALMGELRTAIEQDQLFLHYQPKIDLKTDRIFGVEALARWQHPEHGFIPPVQFIPPAEQTGLIKPLTHWILEAAHRQCLAQKGAGNPLNMSINLSARNLHDGSLPDHLARLLESYGGSGDHLELEITESAIMDDPVRALESIKKMRDMGIRFAIDDFGTGYSSLGYLKRLPVETIKIDKSFVLNMDKDENDDSIVRSTIELGHNLGLQVVAEGVENRETYDRLKELGCDSAQGYFMCKPLSAEDLTRWLEESPWGLKGPSQTGNVRHLNPHARGRDKKASR